MRSRSRESAFQSRGLALVSKSEINMPQSKAHRNRVYKARFSKAANDAARNIHIDDKRRWNGCTGKIPFPSQNKAAARAKSIVAKGGMPAMTAYECPVCGKWHLSKKVK